METEVWTCVSEVHVWTRSATVSEFAHRRGLSLTYMVNVDSSSLPRSLSAYILVVSFSQLCKHEPLTVRETTTTHSLSATTCTTRLKDRPFATNLRNGRRVSILPSAQCLPNSLVERGPGEGPERIDVVDVFFFSMYPARKRS